MSTATDLRSVYERAVCRIEVTHNMSERGTDNKGVNPRYRRFDYDHVIKGLPTQCDRPIFQVNDYFNIHC